MTIHPTAVIDPSAELANGVKVGPYAVIGPRVKIGEDTEIMGHAFIHKNTTIGRACRIFPFASVGGDPQDLKYSGEESLLEIGDRVTIRESATIHRGTEGGGFVTSIGDDSLIMATVHVAHDCRLGKHVILSSYAVLAGHIEVGDWAIIGGLSAIHQFCRVGEHAFLGGGSAASKDLPPFMVAAGARDMELAGPNVVGLRRRGLGEDAIEALMGAYKIICRNHRPLNDVLAEALAAYPGSPEVMALVDFYRNSPRGAYR